MAQSSFRVLIAGGGVAALEAVLALRELDQEGALVVEVVAPGRQFAYRPLSVSDPFGPRATRSYELRPIVAGAGAQLRHGQLGAVEPDERIVTLTDGTRLEYDALLLATGVDRRPAIRGVSTFAGASDAPAFKSFAGSLSRGAYERVAFIVPPGPTWPLPVYELALQAAMQLSRLTPRSREAVQLALLTPESAPLEAFGDVAARAVRAVLVDHGVALHPDTYVTELAGGELHLDMQGAVHVDAAWAAARLVAQVPAGVPVGDGGFVPVDGASRVKGFIDLFAAGDMTISPAKQGGIAAQQAAIAAQAIAALAGIADEPQAAPLVLRAMLLTGAEPLWLRADPASVTPSEASYEPLWWPPHKIFGRHLAPVLAELESRSAA
jgi:sulfide:quinone oxidoreductase